MQKQFSSSWSFSSLQDELAHLSVARKVHQQHLLMERMANTMVFILQWYHVWVRQGDFFSVAIGGCSQPKAVREGCLQSPWAWPFWMANVHAHARWRPKAASIIQAGAAQDTAADFRGHPPAVSCSLGLYHLMEFNTSNIEYGCC